MNGLLIINKPLHYTSMDVIRKVRKLTGIRKVGHAGTLDPLATGVLLVCIGKATKKIDSLMNTTKEYVAEIDLTAFSETDDAQGPLELINIDKIPTLTEIQNILAQFIGEISQMPPKYSALKINGIPAYKKARRGETVELKPRNVIINSIDLISFQWPVLKIKISCGKGTYIRSLARDIGVILKTGGYLISLERTAVGNYRIEDTIDLSKIEKIEEKDLRIDF